MTLRLERHLPAAAAYAVQEHVRAFDQQFIANKASCQQQPLELSLVNANQEVLAGLLAHTYWGALHIGSLWVNAALRGRGYGSRLLAAAEEEARQRGCALALVQTASFNQPRFYLKTGYECIGTVDGWPETHRFYYLKKQLVAPASTPKSSSTQTHSSTTTP